MTPIDCTTIEENLPWLVNDSLPSQEQHVLWRHIHQCDACRRALVACAKLAGDVKKTSQLPIPATIGDIWRAIKGELPGPVRIITPLPDPTAPPLRIVSDVIRWSLDRALQDCFAPI